MGEIYRRTLLARGWRPIPFALAFFSLIVAALVGLLGRPSEYAEGIEIFPWMFSLVTALGMIGTDVQNGSLQLLLSRPVTRNQYLLGRYLGVATLGVGLLGLTLAMTAGTSALRRGHPNLESFIVAWISLSLGLFWMWSVMFFFSTFGPGQTDVAGFIAVWFFAVSVVGVALLTRNTTIIDIARWISSNLRPAADLKPYHVAEMAWPALLRCASNTALVLFLGAWIFNRRQFSYGAG